MGIESATYISQLVASNPVGATDDYATADDHLRLIKAVLQSQFPNFTAVALGATQAELDKLDGLTAVQADLELLSGANAAGLSAAELLLLNGKTNLLTQTAIHATDNPTKNNDGALADDGTLVLAVTNGKYYMVQLVIMFATTDNTKSVRVGLQGPGSATGGLIWTDGNIGADGTVQMTQSEGATLVALDSASFDQVICAHGTYKAGGTGNLAIQWAQAIADAGWTLTRVEGSMMMLTEIG